MKTLRRLGLVSIPLTFSLAGIGMLWLLQVEQAPGSFFEQLGQHRTNWLGAHLLLLLSTVFLVPAALSIRLALRSKLVGALGTALIIIIALTTILLAGQYAIDFVMPLLIEVGGDALQVHGLLFKTPVIDRLFYKLPNLVFLALFLLSCTLLGLKNIPWSVRTILLVNWLLVLLGNLIHPVFQRVAIVLLAFSFLPFVYMYWNESAQDVE